jgi:hypothetical protein
MLGNGFELQRPPAGTFSKLQCSPYSISGSSRQLHYESPTIPTVQVEYYTKSWLSGARKKVKTLKSIILPKNWTSG